MNYYDEIKELLINNKIYKKVKDYSKNRNDLNTYYNVGKILSEAGKHYGEGILKEYSIKLTNELGKGYGLTNLKNMRNFYLLVQKSQAMPDQLSWSHIIEILPLKDINRINYYIDISIKQNLSYRELHKKIKSNEYERLDDKIKDKLIKKEKYKVEDFIKNPIIIKNNFNTDKITEKMFKELILDDIESFMKELGSSFSFIGSEFKIKIGNNYNYIDLLLFNYEYNCFVAVELKVTEHKAEYLGQILKYVNYVDNNIKKPFHDNTIGLIICRENDEFILKYSTNPKIFNTTYKLI